MFGGRLDYIKSANLQLLAIASSFLEMRQLQFLIDSLHVEVRWATSGGSPRNTTSFLCFQISQE